MQPKNVIGGEPKQEEKQPTNKSTVQTWRVGIATAIEKALAPKGYSHIKSGVHKGSKKSNIDYLSDKHVIQVQNIAVNSFDMYRHGVKTKIVQQIDFNKKSIEIAMQDLMNTKFWKLRLRSEITKTINKLQGQNEALQQVCEQLNHIEVK
jgi:hypothetical protein